MRNDKVIATFSHALVRGRASKGLVVALFLLSSLTAAIVAGTIGYSRATAAQSAQQALTQVDNPAEVSLRVSTRQQSTPEAQDAAARQLIQQAFAPTSVSIQNSLRTEPRPVQDRPERIQIIASEDLTPQGSMPITVTAGQWPGGVGGSPLQGALHADAAAHWGLTVEDVVVVDEQSVVIAALWRSQDPSNAVWFNDPLIRSGVTADLVGPLIVDSSTISGFTDPPIVQWTIRPEIDSVDAQALGPIATAATQLRSTLQTESVELRGVQVEGDLAAIAEQTSVRIETSRALAVVPLTLLLTVCLVAVWQLGRLVAAARAGESELLLARGASWRQIIGWSALEVGVVTLAGTTLGALIASGLLSAGSIGPPQNAAVTWASVASWVVVFAALIVAQATHLRRLAYRAKVDQAGRHQAVATVAAIVAIGGAASVSLWQLLRYGSPLVDAEGSGRRADLLAGAAPTLMLSLCAVLALALMGPAMRMLTSTSRRSRKLVWPLATAQVGRRLVLYAVPLVLVVLSVGSATLASFYSATSTRLNNQLAQVQQGADVRATLSAPVTDSANPIPSLPSVQALSGVESVAPVWSTTTTVGTSDADLVAAPLDALSSVAKSPGNPANLSESSDLVGTLMSEPAAGAIALPAGAAVLDVDIAWETETSDDGPTGVIDEVAFYADVLIEEQGVAPDQALSEALSDILGTGGGQQPTVSMQVLEPASGLTHEVALADFAIADDFSRSEGGEVDLDTSTKTAQISIPLPAEGDYQIIGLSVTTSAFLPGVTRTATVTPSVDGEPLSVAPSVESWSSTRDSESELTANTEGELSLVVPLDSTIPDASGQARVSFSGLSVPQALPLALTSSLAETNSLDLGSLVEVQVAGSVVNGQVSALVDAVPGVKSADAILVDAGTLSQAIWAQDQALGYPDELWISATVPTEVAAEVSQIDGISETRDFSAESAVDAAQPVREVFWIAAAGSVLLAGVGVGAASASLSASRRSEVAVLRALGMAASRQARSRALELFAVIGLAALFGAAAGWLVSVVVVPVLAQATLVAGQATVPASLQLDVASWSALLGLQAVLLVLVIARVAQKVARQARDASYREEVR